MANSDEQRAALGEKTRPVVAVFYTLFTVSLFLAGAVANLGGIYYIGIALAALHLGMQVRRVNIDDPDICLRVFRSNIQFGWIVFLALIAAQVQIQLL